MAAPSALATTYYISPKGNDGASGTSPSQAFQSFWAATQHLQPGDTLLLMPGSYPNLGLGVSGTADAPITIRGENPSRPPVIRSATPYPAVWIQANYVVLGNLEVTSGIASLAAALQAYHAHHVTIDHVVAHDSGGGGIMATYCDYVTLTSNTAYRNSWAAPNQTSGIGIGPGLNSDSLPGVHNVVAGNVAHDNMVKVPLPGTNFTTDGNGIIIDTLDNGVPFVGTTLVYNNLAYRNGGAGLHVFRSSNVIATNNTSAGNLRDPLLSGVKSEIGSEFGSGNAFSNNIAKATNPTGYAMLDMSGGGNSFDYNLLSGGAAGQFLSIQSTTQWGSHNLMGKDPRFAGANDFTLQTASPALAIGTTDQAPYDDIRLDPRPHSQPIDLGAYQQTL